MGNAIETPVFLTVRGKSKLETLEAMRSTHNQTAGSAQGIAAARALGDLSHKVYAPVSGPMSSAKPGELLFCDVWEHPQGLMEFFGNPHVATQAQQLFASKDATVWMPARGGFSFVLQPPAGAHERYVGMLRGKISNPEKAIALFNANSRKELRAGRARGQLSHELFIKLNPPGDSSPLELLAIDLWSSAAGMQEHYGKMEMSALAGAFAGEPDASIWQQAPGEWSEW